MFLAIRDEVWLRGTHRPQPVSGSPQIPVSHGTAEGATRQIGELDPDELSAMLLQYLLFGATEGATRRAEAIYESTDVVPGRRIGHHTAQSLIRRTRLLLEAAGRYLVFASERAIVVDLEPVIVGEPSPMAAVRAGVVDVPLHDLNRLLAGEVSELDVDGVRVTAATGAEVRALLERRESAPDTSPYVDEVLHHLARLLSDVEAGYASAERRLDAVYAPERLASEMVSAGVPMPTMWDAGIGPLFTRAAVLRRLSIVEPELDRTVERRDVLELVTSDGVRVYPRFQFQGAGVVPGLGDVLRAFGPGTVSHWTLAAWFTAPSAELEDTSPIDMLIIESQLPRVMAFARDTARRFRQ